MALSTFLRNDLGGSSGTSTSSPGKVKGEPYTALETERPVPSFGVALKPKKTRGRWGNQSESANLAQREDFKLLWNLSTSQLLWGWKEVVVEGEIPKTEQTPFQIEDVNWEPLSDVRTAGIPNLDIQMKARTQDSAEIEDNGTTSGHLVVLSIMVKR